MKKMIVTIMLFGSLCTQADQPMTPLMSAAYNLGNGDYNKNFEAIVVLVERGVTKEDLSNAYQAYLKGGAVHGNQFDPFVYSLLTKPNLGITPLQARGMTPLMSAAYNLNAHGDDFYNNNIQAMVSLIYKGADITVKDSQNNTAYQWYLKGGTVHGNQLDPFVQKLLTTPNLGITPLMVAAYQDDFKTIKALVDQGADITVKDSQNNTAYQWYLKGGTAHGNGYDASIASLLKP